MNSERDMVRWRDADMRAYLLGTLDAGRKAALEEVIFEDEQAYDALLDARYDLLDDHARGALSETEREQVERRLLSDAGEGAIRLAHLLMQRQASPSADSVVEPRAPSRNDWRLLAAAAVAVIATGATLWLAIDNRHLRAGLEDARATRAAATGHELVAGSVARLELRSQTTRSEATPEFSVSPGADVVEIVVAVSDAAAVFRVSLEARGGALWTERGITRGSDGALHVWLSATRLSAGAYELLVYGGSAADAPLVAAIPFRIRP